MNLEPAPRLNKTPFYVTAAVCFAVMLLIGLLAPNKFSTVPLIIAVAFLILSITAIMIPLIVDYAADSAEYVQAERGRVAEQVQRLHAAGESLTRAAAQIKAVEEAVHKTAHTAENLPYRMQEKLAEFNEALTTKETEEREVLERELEELRAANSDNLKGVADKIAKATADWSALEASTRKQLTAAQDASAKLNDQLKATLAQLESRLAEITKAAASAPVAAVYDRRAEPAPATETGGHRPPPQEEAPPAAEELAAPSPIESVTLTETAPAPAEEVRPKKPRAPRKPRPEDTLAAMSAEPAAEAGNGAEAAPAPSASEEAPAASFESSASSDGATRLLVTAYIGIGNKLFIRGDGPGLSWDKGVPMQFVSIGKWGWASHDVATPIACKLYKNDETAALSGEIFLEPGKHVEVTALF